MTKKSALPNPGKKPGDTDEGIDPEALPGWPGYRTREGRSGYDPIDTRIEAAHVSGTLIQNLLTGNLKIKNPIVLFLSGVLGFLLVAPLILTIYELFNGNTPSWEAALTFFVAGLIGFSLLANFARNLRR
jgi:hypothetical protein